MAQARLGKMDEARTAFQSATQVGTNAFPTAGNARSFQMPYHVWAMCEVLRREAEALLKAEPAPAPKEETP